MNKKKKTFNIKCASFNMLILIFTSESLICKSRRCSHSRVSAHLLEDPATRSLKPQKFPFNHDTSLLLRLCRPAEGDQKAQTFPAAANVFTNPDQTKTTTATNSHTRTGCVHATHVHSRPGKSRAAFLQGAAAPLHHSARKQTGLNMET